MSEKTSAEPKVKSADRIEIRPNDSAVLRVGASVVVKRGDEALGHVTYDGDKNALLNALAPTAAKCGQVPRIDERVIGETSSVDEAGHITNIKTIERTLILRDG